MSLESVYGDLRRVRHLLGLEFVPDSTELTIDQVDPKRAASEEWLNPKLFAQFDPSDFEALPEPEVDALRSAVASFREAVQAHLQARDANGTGESTDHARALASLLQILAILRPDQYQDAEAFALGKSLEPDLAGLLPDWIRRVEFRTGHDHWGNPAVWIACVGDEGRIDRESMRRWFLEHRDRLYDLVYDDPGIELAFIQLQSNVDRDALLSEVG